MGSDGGMRNYFEVGELSTELIKSKARVVDLEAQLAELQKRYDFAIKHWKEDKLELADLKWRMKGLEK